MIWQRGDHGQWERTLVRTQHNRGPIASRLIRVEPEIPTCMACLSSNVRILESDRYRHGELLCYECGVQYGFV